MGQFRYEVEYSTDEPPSFLKERLASICEGAWDLRSKGLFVLRRRNYKYGLSFELENDLLALLKY